MIFYEKRYTPNREPFYKIYLCELKKEKIGISAFLQSLRYVKGIISYLGKFSTILFQIEIVLIGKSIDDTGSFIFIPDLINNYDEFNISNGLTDVSFYTFDYGFDGIHFKSHFDYDLTEKGF